MLSRPSRAAGPWEGRLPSAPGRGGLGRGSPEPASASGTATCSRAAQGLSGTALSHPELGRPRKRHTSHPGLNRPHLANSPLAGAGGLGRATCVPRRVCTPRPWGGAGGLRAIEPRLQCSARRPGAPGFLSRPLPRSLSSTGSSRCLTLPTRPSNRPGLGLPRWAPGPWDRFQDDSAAIPTLLSLLLEGWPHDQVDRQHSVSVTQNSGRPH